MKTSFYSAEILAAYEKKNRIWKAVLAALCLAALGLIVLFCLRTNTLNAPRMEGYATLTFLLAGWVAITIHGAALRYDRALAAHIGRILEAQGEERRVRGRVTVEKKSAAIPGSIDVRRVRIETADGTERAFVGAPFAAALEKAAAADGETTLCLIGGYVTGVER